MTVMQPISLESVKDLQASQVRPVNRDDGSWSEDDGVLVEGGLAGPTCEPPLTRVVPRGRPTKKRLTKGEMGKESHNNGGLPDIPNKAAPPRCSTCKGFGHHAPK